MDADELLTGAKDRGQPPELRVAMVRALAGREIEQRGYGELCTLFLDETEHADVRCSAAATLAANEGTAAMAVNVLTRPVQSTLGDRPVRAAAVAALRARGAAPARLEPWLRDSLARLQRGGDALAPSLIVNMAATYGWDLRVVAALRGALGSADPTLRQYALRSLAQLGETEAVLGALADPAPAVRASAAEALGWWGLGQARELEALRRAGADPEPGVARAATVALRRLGALPIRRPRPARRRPRATAEDPRFPWRPLLERWSRQWLRFDEYAAELPDDVAESGWIGYPPASQQQIAAAEQRLGVALPPSYRAFLRVSNGWRRTSPFISRLWGAEEIEWLRVRNQELIDIWNEQPYAVPDEEYFVYGDSQDSVKLRAEYLGSALEVSDWGDSAIYLLNPQVVTPDGEWEAWFFASWYPGAGRYRSFWELMQAEYAGFLELRSP